MRYSRDEPRTIGIIWPEHLPKDLDAIRAGQHAAEADCHDLSAVGFGPGRTAQGTFVTTGPSAVFRKQVKKQLMAHPQLRASFSLQLSNKHKSKKEY